MLMRLPEHLPVERIGRGPPRWGRRRGAPRRGRGHVGEGLRTDCSWRIVRRGGSLVVGSVSYTTRSPWTSDFENGAGRSARRSCRWPRRPLMATGVALIVLGVVLITGCGRLIVFE
jgi:hypothetical protein